MRVPPNRNSHKDLSLVGEESSKRREGAEFKNARAEPRFIGPALVRCGTGYFTIMINFALLKLQLLYYGIRGGGNLISPLTNPFGLVHLVLPEKVSVSVHLNTNGNESPFTLRRDGQIFYLDIGGRETVQVHWTPPLRSYQDRVSSGLIASRLAALWLGDGRLHQTQYQEVSKFRSPSRPFA